MFFWLKITPRKMWNKIYTLLDNVTSSLRNLAKLKRVLQGAQNVKWESDKPCTKYSEKEHCGVLHSQKLSYLALRRWTSVSVALLILIIPIIIFMVIAWILCSCFMFAFCLEVGSHPEKQKRWGINAFLKWQLGWFPNKCRKRVINWYGLSNVGQKYEDLVWNRTGGKLRHTKGTSENSLALKKQTTFLYFILFYTDYHGENLCWWHITNQSVNYRAFH